MKKVFLFLSFALALSLCSCVNKNLTETTSNTNRYIESISPTLTGRLSPISFSFINEPKDSVKVENYVSLKPDVKGSWNVDGKNVSFVPSVPFKANSKITLTVNCAKLFGDESAKKFQHNFYVANPEYSITFDEIRFDEKNDEYSVNGSVTTDIPVSAENIASTLNANFSGKKQQVKWSESDKAEIWNFTIPAIKADFNNKKLNVSWNAKKLGFSRQQNKLVAGKKTITIPSKEVFGILDINTEKENTILVSFSKTIDPSQDVASFVRTLNKEGVATDNFNATVHGNVLTLFNDSDWLNVDTVTVEKGIKSTDGVYLEKTSSVTLSPNWNLPSVRFKNDNIILPSTSQNGVLAVETQNLTGLIIQVYDISQRNINHFLQVNELDGTKELYRVGDPIWQKKVSFDWNDSMQNTYVTRGLDLSDLAKKYPHGMFHVRLSFRKDQIKYVCHNNHGNFSNLPMPPDTIEEYRIPNERSSWDYWENSNTNSGNYWSYDDDPCHPAFYLPRYNSNSVISRNILVSDLGIMVKRDTEGLLYISVASLKTAKPVSGATVELLNYVGNPIASVKTNADGSAVLKDNGKTFAVAATLNNETSYLKLSAGTSLSVSHFEIGGEKIENGVKGAIYGERGVWRPGDKMYLTFVLQDLKKTLPKDIPVTFELKDPMGRTVSKKVLTESVNGFYPIETETTSDATTGLWTGTVTIGGRTWSKYLSVEVVVPNKLSVELTSNKKYLETNDNEFELKGAWLHGAPTPSYKADVSVSFSETATNFDGYSEFTFTNPMNHIESSRSTIWEGHLNADSVARFNARLDAGRNLPGKLKANFVSKIYQPAGGFSTQSKNFDYSPYSSYVGIKLPKGDAARNMLLTDTDHTVDVVLLDASGKPVSESKNLSYTVYKIEWKWWWEKDAYTSATHVSSSYYNRVASGTVNVNNGKGSFIFNVKYPDWGRYLVEVKDGSYGHSSAKIVYIDWPGWAGRAQEGGSGSASMVPLVTSKKTYTVGETAEVSFSASDEARALVTVEKGGRIIKQQWIETSSGTNVFKLPLTAEMSPNVYVHLTLLQPHLQTRNSLPIRLYGVVPVTVDNPETKLSPVITMPSQYEPNKPASITVSEEKGKPMTYTLAVVDEGLLGLTNYHGPDLRKQFYKKEASEIESFDLYKYVMNAYSGKLETLLSIGGGEDGEDDGARDENRFTPVVKYFGPFTLAAGEKKTTTFDMPYYIGAVRAVVIAGSDGAYGVAEKSTPVKSELMTQCSIPRTLGCNEYINIPVTVFNGMNTGKKISVTFKATGAATLNRTSEIYIQANSNAILEFPIVTKTLGDVTIEVTAKSDSKTVSSSDKVQVMSRGIPVSYRSSFTVKPGKTESVSVPTPGEKDTSVLTMEISTLPQIDLSSRLAYLTEYPHGCIEQITSGGFPQLYVPAFAKLSVDEVNKIKKNVLSVFERYPTYQTVSGAFGYWPGNQQPHAWGTCYATHFMLEAKKKGYSVPDSVLNPALKWLKETAANWTSGSSESASVQAYRLYVLSLAGTYDTAAMNRLNTKSISGDAALLLAAAYANAGRKNNAVYLLKNYSYNNSSYRNFDNTFSSSIRETAIYLHASVASGYTNDIPSLAKEISTTLSSDAWLSTQETAWSLNALLPYYSQQNVQEASYEITANNSKKISKLSTLSATERLTYSSMVPNQNAVITNTGKTILYGTLVINGMSVPGTEKIQNEGLRMTVSGLSAKDLSDLKTGDTLNFTVRISNESRKDLTNIALTVPAPTCLEIMNERVGNESYRNSSYTYQDIRDEAVYTYFDLRSGSSVTYSFSATVANSGTFYIPAIHAEAMYDNSIVAVYPGQIVRAK